MPEEQKLFYTIGEVAQMVEVKPYVLRYWETEFKKLNPQKSVTGQRAYRKRDIEIALTIKQLLYGEKYTIAGALKKLEQLDEKDELVPMAETVTEHSGSVLEEDEEEEPASRTLPETPSVSKTELPSRVPLEKAREMLDLIDTTKEILKRYGLT